MNRIDEAFFAADSEFELPEPEPVREAKAEERPEPAAERVG